MLLFTGLYQCPLKLRKFSIFINKILKMHTTVKMYIGYPMNFAMLVFIFTNFSILNLAMYSKIQKSNRIIDLA